MKTPAVPLLLASLSIATAADWPNWRGPNYNGSAPDATPPLKWSETENVKWKVEIPGQGNATPIVIGNQVFVLTAISTETPGSGGAQPPQPPRPQADRRGSTESGRNSL